MNNHFIFLYYRLYRTLKNWELFHECTTFRNYPSETRYFQDGHKECHYCGKKYPLFSIKIKHQR